MSLSGSEIRDIFDETVVVRRPTYGIISGYHELPYVCLGESIEAGYRTTEVRGTVQVSPKFVVTPSQFGPSYEEIFGEDNVDAQLTGRVFGILGFRGRPVECTSEHLNLKHLDASVDRVLSGVLDELERKEDVTSGVFICPKPQYFPISIERFISTVLEDEFKQ